MQVIPRPASVASTALAIALGWWTGSVAEDAAGSAGPVTELQPNLPVDSSGQSSNGQSALPPVVTSDVLLAQNGDLPAEQTPAPSESGQQTISEVVVTARKREERLQDIPESITAVTSSNLEEYSIQTIEDLGRQTPNLQLNMRQDLTTDVVIRGVGAYGDVLGVGFNIDDVPNFTDQTMRLEDLERVEILKGPQGTLYGGSAIGGLVRYVAKQPTFDYDGEVSAEVGSYYSINLFAAQNAPLIPDKLAMRFSVYESKTDGYVTNSALSIDGSPSQDYGARMMLLFKPTDGFSALLTLRHSYIRNGADEYPPVTSVKSYTYDAPFFQQTFNTRSVYGGVLELNGQFHSLNLTSITSGAYALYAQSADISFTPPGVPGQTLLTLPGNRPTRVSTQEFRVASPSTGNFTWLAGLYGAVIEDVLLNQNGVANYPPPPDLTTINDFDTRRVDAALFGTAGYHLGPWSIEGGVRLTETHFKSMVYIEAGGLPDQSGSITSKAVLPKVSISYNIPNGPLLYVNVARGMEPGAVNSVSTAPIPYKSETAFSYELGVKGQTPDRKLEYDLATFYVSNNNHQFETNQYIPSEGGLVTLISNIGDSRTYGQELTTTWRPTTDLSFTAGGGYLNARWEKAVAYGSPIDGNYIPNAPNVTASVSASYSRPAFNSLLFTTNFDMSYTDAMWWDLPNTPGSKEPPHWIGGLRFSLGQQHPGWQVSFRIANILGAKYWTEYYPNFFPQGGYPCNGCANIGAIGAPREFFGEIAYKY